MLIPWAQVPQIMGAGENHKYQAPNFKWFDKLTTGKFKLPKYEVRNENWTQIPWAQVSLIFWNWGKKKLICGESCGKLLIYFVEFWVPLRRAQDGLART